MNIPEKPKSTPRFDPNSRPPRKSLAAWTLLLPALLLLGVIWQASREPEIGPAKNSAEQSPATNPRNAPTKPQPAKRAASRAVKRVFFVPDDEGELRRREVSESESAAEKASSSQEEDDAISADRALRLMLKAAPGDFPSGTRLVDQKTERPKTPLQRIAVRSNMDRCLATVNLSKQFENPDFWQGSTRTISTIYAIVNTVSKTVGSECDETKVQLLIEGKPASTLGEFDASDPIEPDMSLVAKN